MPTDKEALDRYLSQSDEDWHADHQAMESDDRLELQQCEPATALDLVATFLEPFEYEIVKDAIKQQGSDEQRVIAKLMGFIQGFIMELGEGYDASEQEC